MINESPHLGSLLVVDDTLENLRLLGNMLGGEGYEGATREQRAREALAQRDERVREARTAAPRGDSTRTGRDAEQAPGVSNLARWRNMVASG